MMKPRISMFAEHKRQGRREKLDDPLVGLSKHVDFVALANGIEAAAPRPSRAKGGFPPYPTLLMVKILVRQQLYDLADDALEYQLLDRRSFLQFLDLTESSSTPEVQTIWLFRDRLVQAGAGTQVFEQVQRQLQGHGYMAPYDSGRDQDVTTWQGDWWKVGGGIVWGWITYDPDSNLMYYGNGNPGLWNPLQRPDYNKWTSSMFARDADTGAAKWAVQYSPHDLHDYDGINESVLIDVTVGGKQRKAMLHPDRNGYLHLTDRLSDEIISAQPCVFSNSILDVDLKTGRPVLNPDKAPLVGAKVSDIGPAAPGGKDWQLTPASIWKLVAYVRTPSRSAAEPVGAAPTDKQPGKP